MVLCLETGGAPTGLERRRPENRQLRERIDAVKKNSEIVLAETRHRFTNAFQIFSSLIQLRLAQTDDREARRRLFELMEFAAMIGQLHQHLHGAEAEACFATYLGKQALIWRSLWAEHNIALLLDCDAISVSPEKAMPLALIANELVTNCGKHAFPKNWNAGPNSRNSIVRVELKRCGDGYAELRVVDNGIGLLRHSASVRPLGLKLVRGLAAQAGGTFSIESGAGTTARVRFGLNEASVAGAGWPAHAE